jgi:hypothetical protein
MSDVKRPGSFGPAQETALRDAFRAAVPQAHRDTCPELVDIERALAGELKGEPLAQVTRALAECALCAALARMSTDVAVAARDAAARAGEPGAAQSVPANPEAPQPMPVLPQPYNLRRRRRSTTFASRAWAVAAVVLVGIGLSVLLPVFRGESDPVLRGLADAAQVVPEPGATLQAPPIEFRWEAERGVTGYVVEVFDATAEPVWSSPTLAHPRAVPDPAAQDRLRRGDFVWRVQAHGPGQAQTLGPWRFSVRGE